MEIVSIIIPAYNAENYIEQTIKSVIEQEFEAWELIIINDGSTDNTLKIIKKFDDNRIKVISTKNQGVSAARNTGIKASQGKYIAFLDADDVWLSDNLIEKVSQLESNSEIDWVYSNMYHADEVLNIIEVAPSGTDQDIIDSILLWEGEVVPGPCSNIVVKRKIVDDAIYFDTNLSTAADQDFCLSLAAIYLKAHYIDKPLWKYRLTSSSMHQNIAKMESDHIYIYKKADTLGLFKSWFFKRRCYSNLYLILAGSWWINEKNKIRGLYFFILSICMYPMNVQKIISKILRRLIISKPKEIK